MELLSAFLQAATEDQRLLPTHISLYLALFVQWDGHTILVNKDILMQASKISGRSTYQRCIKQLACYGYISYRASFNRFEASQVYLKDQFKK
jgi:hypothetical protein